MKLNCQWCGQEFEASRKDTKYCSRSCQAKASRDRLKKGINSAEHTCLKCGKTFLIKDYAFNRKYCYECLPQAASGGAAMRRLVKQWALDYKGHQCCICGYNKCDAALEFHHRDPSKKDFIISDNNMSLNWPIIQQELDKCDLVCANCHREIHMKEYQK